MAERWLDGALQIKPRDTQSRSLLAEAYYRRDDFARASELFRAMGREAMARKLESFRDFQPYSTPETFSGTVLRFLKTDPLPVVPVKVNGLEVRFIIDTGGSEIILSKSLAGQVAIRQFGEEYGGAFGGGKTAPIAHGHLEELGVGNVAVSHLPVIIMNLDNIGPILGEGPIDGIIGTVFLYHFLSTIDYPGARLTLERRSGNPKPPPRPASPVKDTMSMPFWMAGDHFMVARGTVNEGPSMLFFVDTGPAGGGFTCPKSTLDRAKIELNEDRAFSSAGGGGSFTAIPFEVDTLSLGDMRRSGIKGFAGAFPPQLENAFGFRIGGLISHQFFRPYALTFDFDTMHLRLST